MNPFKVRYGNAPSIRQNVGNNENTLVVKNFIGFGSGRSISAFSKNFTLYAVGVFGCNLIFSSARGKYVAFNLKKFAVIYNVSFLVAFKRFCICLLYTSDAADE